MGIRIYDSHERASAAGARIQAASSLREREVYGWIQATEEKDPCGPAARLPR